ncbi:acyl-CoA N-acyltransferase [Aspergillus aurantiobrunneus]
MLPTTPITITTATPADIPTIKSLVAAAFTKYIHRIGKPPAPMLASYDDLHGVFVLTAVESNHTILGSITLSEDPDSDAVKINNLVVDPAAQGRGYGRLLVEFAEGRARESGRGVVALATNVKMYENLGLYKKLGFVEVGRGMEEGYERVFLRKNVDS